MTRPLYVLVYRCADHAPGPGEIRSMCSRCGAPVWFNLDAEYERARDRGAPMLSIVCTRCVQTDHARARTRAAGA